MSGTIAIPPKELLEATIGGLSILVISGGSTGYVLTKQSDGTYAPAAASSASGDVVGPSSATDNAAVRFDSTTGKLVQNSAVTIDDSGNITCGGLNASAPVCFPVGSKTAPGLRIVGASTVGFFSIGSQVYFSDGGGGGANSVGFVGGVRLPRVGYLGFTSTVDATDVSDVKYGRDSGSAKGKVFANSGFGVRNFADSADSAFSCSSITLSGASNLAPITKSALLLLTPNAATGGRWRVTDATPASREAYPDGTDWRYTSDDTVVT